MMQALGSNEKLVIQLLEENGGNLKRKQIINWIRLEHGILRESISRTLKNMVEKGLLLFDWRHDRYTLVDHWQSIIQALGHNFLPQELISLKKRMEIFALAIDNVGLNESELLGLYGMLDLNMDNIRKLKAERDQAEAREVKEKSAREKENDQLIEDYRKVIGIDQNK